MVGFDIYFDGKAAELTDNKLTGIGGKTEELRLTH